MEEIPIKVCGTQIFRVRVEKVNNQNLRKLFLVVLGLFLFSGVKVFSKTVGKKEYWAIRNVNINSLGPVQRALHHKKMTKILVRLGALEKKPNFFKGNKFSYEKFLNELTGSLIPMCHAEGSADNCLFGGWVSVRSGRCNTPYSSTGKAAAAEAGTSQYDSSSFCNSSNLFRCNPLVFGPGMDQAAAGDEFSNINGFANNSAPYSAGICVDISSGFNGLSQKCQNASDHLDKVRAENGEQPWRESEFFNEERAEDFKALQAVIADRCEANRETINADGMCDSLEKSLGLTASVAAAGKLNGINIEDIMPQCTGVIGSEGDAPACEKSDDATLKNLYAAMEKLKEQENCQFGRIKAMDQSTSMSRILLTSTCPVAILGSLREGLGGERNKVVLQMRDKNGTFSGQIDFETSLTESEDDILAKIRAHSEFGATCQRAANSSCNHPAPNSAGESIIAQLDEIKKSGYEVTRGAMGHIKENVSCSIEGIDLGVAHETDNSIRTEEGAAARNRTAACPVYFSGEVKDLLDNNQFSEGANGVGTTISLYKGGSVLTIPHTVSSANMGSLATDIQSNEKFQEFCRGSSSDTVEDLAAAEAKAVDDVKQMRETFGIAEGDYLTADQSAGLTKLREIEGLSVEVDEFGKITFSHDDLQSIEGQLNDAFGELSIGPSTESVSVFPNPETRVNHLAARASLTLTAQEREIITPIVGSGADDSVTVISGITRDGEGNLVFLTNRSTTSQGALSDRQIASFTRMADGMVIDPAQEESDPSLIRSYTIRAPSSEEFGVSAAAYPTEISGSLRSGITAIQGNLDRRLESFDIVAGEPSESADGAVTVKYDFNIEGDSGNAAENTIGRFYNPFRASLPDNCEILPRQIRRIKDDRSFSVTCRP
jgi:hypothetical protein